MKTCSWPEVVCFGTVSLFAAVGTYVIWDAGRTPEAVAETPPPAQQPPQPAEPEKHGCEWLKHAESEHIDIFCAGYRSQVCMVCQRGETITCETFRMEQCF